MATPAFRDFVALETSTLDHWKWSELDWEQRGKWAALLLLAKRQATPGVFRDRATVERLLAKEGDTQPRETVETFLRLRLLDEVDDGTAVHDFEEYLPPKSTERVREHRKRQKEKQAAETLRNVSQRSQDNTTQATKANTNGVEREGAGRERNSRPQAIGDILGRRS